jgi:hypothetical protein
MEEEVNSPALLARRSVSTIVFLMVFSMLGVGCRRVGEPLTGPPAKAVCLVLPSDLVDEGAAATKWLISCPARGDHPQSWRIEIGLNGKRIYANLVQELTGNVPVRSFTPTSLVGDRDI